MISASQPLSTLQLRFHVLGDRIDRPVVQILVDGREAFVDQVPGWIGFDPADLLGEESPLWPEDLGRRVAVYRCSCGIAGCGVIAPLIVPSPDGRRVSWVDFRGYVGVFDGPTVAGAPRSEGSPWPIQDLHFDRGAYLAEVARASADRSWETPRRVTARLIAQRLRARQVGPAPAVRLRWVTPAHDQDGVLLGFESGPADRGVDLILRLTSELADPDAAALDIVDQLSAVSPQEWRARFGWRRRRR
jgi:hypothetical protein